jgi:hypothetical protein
MVAEEILDATESPTVFFTHRIDPGGTGSDGALHH